MGDQRRGHPIFSTRADEPSLADAIERFVVRLAERIDDLQDAEREGDLERLARLAGLLERDADAAGYEPLARAARLVTDSALADKGNDARGQLIELTAVAQRVRLGHPGAF
ncbi:MAG: hypothetical protein QNK04_14715 [Myxococcota bacterium]|nr:hypothetical protein [Myxococcota bacterium]